MKYFFLLTTCMLLAGRLFAQYLPVNGARQLIRDAKTSKEKFAGYRGLDRFYYTAGLYDSSAMLQKKMFALAEHEKDDSLITMAYVAIGNRYATKTDYNFALSADFKGLEYAQNKALRASLYTNIAYVYACTGTNQLALGYLNKSVAVGDYLLAPFYRNVLYGLVYNNLGHPDSALVNLEAAANKVPKNPDPTMNSIMLAQTGKAYELRGDNDLAEVYYKRVFAYCIQYKLASGQIRHGSLYCDFFIKAGNYAGAKNVALQNLAVAKKAGINEGISTVAEILRKVYAHQGNRDSSYYYAVMQINYKDSVSNQKRVAEFQNITFTQQLRELDEAAKAAEASEQRGLNIEYASLALGIVVFIILFLLLARGVITNEKVIEFFGVLALLIVFEFLNLVLHPFLENVTNHSAWLMLVALVCMAAVLVPLHHRIEKWATRRLVEKNKTIRLAKAKRVIQELEKKD